ncbi:MAG: signal peptidase I [Cyanobacteria bacterium J06642_9]
MTHAKRSRLYIQPPLGPEAWVAVNLSMLFPGIGQFYSGAIFKGFLFSATAICLLIYIGWSLFAAEGNTLRGIIGLLIGVLLYGINLVDACRSLSQKSSAKPAHSKNQRWYAIFLSQILPGLGHFYQQQALIGGLLFGVGVLTAFGANFNPALLPIPPFIWAIACYHIYRTVPDRKPRLGAIAVVILGLLTVRLTVSYIPVWVDRSLVQCIVPSESMVPTLLVNDRVFVNRQPGFRPQTGDIVVFEPPVKAIAKTDVEPETLLVKRVIGLPGQTVQVTQGQVLINQTPLVEAYETRSPTYEWGPAIIPPESYFLLGDNRDFSADSHVWGAVPRSNLLGPAYKIYWPPARIQPLD